MLFSFEQSSRIVDRCMQYTSGSDTYHWNTDPDPALFFSGFQDANSFFSLRFFVYILRTVGTFTLVFKNNKSLRRHKTVEIKIFI